MRTHNRRQGWQACHAGVAEPLGRFLAAEQDVDHRAGSAGGTSTRCLALLGASNINRARNQVLSERVMLARLTANRMDASLGAMQRMLALLAAGTSMLGTRTPIFRLLRPG